MLIVYNARTEDSLDVMLGGGIEKHFAKHFVHNKLQDNFWNCDHYFRIPNLR